MVALALHSVVPVRAEAREGAEQNTQMLFGELCEILEEQARWRRIRLESDGQEGWVDAKMICPMKSEEYASYRQAYDKSALVAFPMTYAVSENNGQTIPLTAGTRLTHYQNGRFEVLGVGFRIDPSMVIEQPKQMNQENLLQTVRFFLNIPYLWGGKNAMGMDCSGFTQVVMSLFGKQLLRNASEQVTQGQAVSSLKDVQTGDLVFFNHQSPITNDQRQALSRNDQPPITHVGIAIDAERVIHCSGRVKVEKLDETGIFSAETGDYTHHLAAIRRI